MRISDWSSDVCSSDFGAVESLSNGEIGGRGLNSRECLAIEGICRRCHVEVVLLAAAGDVDIGLGAGRGRIDPAGGDVPGGPLHRVAGQGVGMVDANLATSAWGPVAGEEATGDVDLAGPVRSETRRERKECGSKCRYRGMAEH